MSQVWFVTGSSRGLGRAIAEAALADGDQVVATARRTAHLDGLVERYGENVLPIALDVTDPEHVHRVVQQGLDAFGRYDVVVNNAGYADVAAVEDVTLEDFHAQIDTNFFGVVHVTKAVLPALRERGSGHIFQVSSLASRFTSPGLSAYQSAKWAVVGFSTGLAQEVAPLGIRVTVVEPGAMRTDWAGSSMTIPEVSEPYQQTVGQLATLIRSALRAGAHRSARGGPDRARPRRARRRPGPAAHRRRCVPVRTGSRQSPRRVRREMARSHRVRLANLIHAGQQQGLR